MMNLCSFPGYLARSKARSRRKQASAFHATCSACRSKQNLPPPSQGVDLTWCSSCELLLRGARDQSRAAFGALTDGQHAAKPQPHCDPARGFWVGQKLTAGGGHPLFLAPSWGLRAVCMLLPGPCHRHQYAGPVNQPVYSSCLVAFSLPHPAIPLQTIHCPISPSSIGLSLKPFVQTLSQGYLRLFAFCCSFFTRTISLRTIYPQGQCHPQNCSPNCLTNHHHCGTESWDPPSAAYADHSTGPTRAAQTHGITNLPLPKIALRAQLIIYKP